MSSNGKPGRLVPQQQERFSIYQKIYRAKSDQIYNDIQFGEIRSLERKVSILMRSTWVDVDVTSPLDLDAWSLRICSQRKCWPSLRKFAPVARSGAGEHGTQNGTARDTYGTPMFKNTFQSAFSSTLLLCYIIFSLRVLFTLHNIMFWISFFDIVSIQGDNRIDSL